MKHAFPYLKETEGSVINFASYVTGDTLFIQGGVGMKP